ncbi:MAG: hypothetical protein ACOVLE_00015, partial [Pirellula staleyi]
MVRTLTFSALVVATIVQLAKLTPVIAQYDGAVPPPETLVTGFDSISAEQSQAWLSILAGPVFEGRGTGQLGYVLTTKRRWQRVI